MRKVLLSLAAAPLLFSAVAFTPVSASAMTLGDPVGVAAGSSSLLQQVDCRQVWRCGYWGCGWRNVCWRDGDDHPRWGWWHRDRDDWRGRRDRY